MKRLIDMNDAELSAACDSDTVKRLLKERGLSRRDLERLGSFSERTVRRIMAGTRKLSEIERRGLESLPKKRGPKPRK